MKKLNFLLLVFMTASIWSVDSVAQCNFTSPFGSATAASTCGPTTVLISSFTWASEYNTIFGIIAGQTYRVTSSNTNDWITIRHTTAGGTVVSHAIQGTNWVAPVNGTYFAHVSTNSTCGTESISRTTRIVTVSGCPSAPTNNDCAAATTLTRGAAGAACTNTAGTSVNATQSLAACAGTADDDVWYQFTATATSHTVTVTPTTMSDVVFQVLSGACNGTSVVCIDATLGTSAETTTLTGLTIGTVYRIRVYSWANGSGQGTFNICVTTPAAPTYNPCTTIPTIAGCGTSVTAAMTGTGAGWSVISCDYATPGQERLFQFTAPTTGTYTLNVSAITGGFVDFFWKPASGGCNATGWNCIDDIVTTGVYSAITPMTFTAGTTYYILLDPEGTGTYSAIFNLVCPSAPPANDLVCNAISISCGETLSGTTVGAENSGTGENLTCGTAQTMPGVWYVVPGNGQIMTASLCGTAWDSKISVYSGTNCSSLTCVGGIDDNGPACGGASASYSWSSVSGTNYYILVHGYSSTSAFSINLSCVTPTPPPANDNCANAQSITIQCPASATAVSGTTANATEEAMADPSCDPGTIRDVWYTFNSGPNSSVDLTLTLGTASWIGGEVHTTCGNPAPGLTIGGNPGNCDFYLLNPSPTVISGLVPNTTYRLRLFTNVDYDIAGTFTFTLTNSTNNPGAVSVPASICVGTPTSISNVTAATGGPNNVNYYFYYRGGPSNVGWQMYDGPTTNTSSSLPSAVINTPGTWFIARNSDFGCGQTNNATTVDLQLIVNSSPTVSLNCPALCPGDASNITATPSPAGTYTYNWTALPGGVSDPGNSATVNTSTVGNYEVIATNTATGCQSAATSCPITVSSPPSINAISPP